MNENISGSPGDSPDSIRRRTCPTCHGVGCRTCARCQGAGIVGGMSLTRHASTGQTKLATYHPCPECSSAGGARGQIPCRGCAGVGQI